MVRLREGLWGAWIALKEPGRLPEYGAAAERAARALSTNRQRNEHKAEVLDNPGQAGQRAGRMALAGLRG